MSFGYIAIAAVTLASAAYSSDQARKGRHEVADAQRDADIKDAQQKAELETSTAVAANAKFAADKRARQANVLALGGASSPLGGAPAGGQTTGASATSVGGPASSSVLGSGAPGGGYTPPGSSTPRSTIGGGGGGASRGTVRPY